MATFFELKDRRVLPNWRSFLFTVMNGELDGLVTDLGMKKHRDLSIEDYLFAWKQEKSVPIAGDLISAAFSNNLVQTPEIKVAAKYILSSKERSTESQKTLAKYILSNTKKGIKKLNGHCNPEDLIDSDTKRVSISNIRKNIRKYNFNPIFYVDLSRLHSILGNKEKAIKNMKIALQLSPQNRFVLRAASRLFAHFDMIDFIHNIIKNSDVVKYDPWITSTEIALATIKGYSSKFIKIGRKMVNLGDFSPLDITELAASIGTLEFINANRKQSKKLFKTALINPNDNSLAQTEWIMNKDRLFEFHPESYKVINKQEALALDNYFNHNWEETLNQCITWYCDIPFSKRSIILGSNMSTIFLNNAPIGRKLLKAGLISHPNDAQIINNLSYSYALENRIREAEEEMSKIKKFDYLKETTKVCLIATKGLISFRKGDIDDGREKYLKAIDESKKIQNKYYHWSAILNYAREEIKANSDNAEYVTKLIEKIPDKSKRPEINKLKENVIELIQNKKERK